MGPGAEPKRRTQGGQAGSDDARRVRARQGAQHGGADNLILARGNSPAHPVDTARWEPET